MFSKVVEFVYDRVEEEVTIGPFKDSLVRREGVWLSSPDKVLLEHLKKELIRYLKKWNRNFTARIEEVI